MKKNEEQEERSDQQIPKSEKNKFMCRNMCSGKIIDGLTGTQKNTDPK